MLHSFRVLILCFLPLSVLQAQSLSKKDMLQDLAQLQEELTRFHPGLNRYMRADSMDYYFDLVEARMPEQMKAYNFYGEVTFLLNKVRCGHTRASMPFRTRERFRADHLFMPVAIKYLGNRMYIDKSLAPAPALRRGDEVLAINGKPVSEFTHHIFDHHAADGVIETGKYRQTEAYFPYYYQLYVDQDAEVYSFKVRSKGGQVRDVKVEGQDWETVGQIMDRGGRAPELKLEHRDAYSYMRISTFVGYIMNKAGLEYEEFLEESFQELNEKGVKQLVLDLRGNGGGTDNFGALLVSYFANQPFKYFERIEVTNAYSGYGDVVKSDGRNLMTSHKGLTTWQPKANRFKGKLYVLTDGRSFSTCADVATVLHHHDWATFIGEETGGGYDGNTSGNSKTLTLRNSKVDINLPMWMYTTANLGHAYPGRGAIPDHEIIPSLDEYLAGTDVGLKKAEELIKASRR